MSNASSTMRGFTFQDCASMVLFLDHIKEIDSIRIEGKDEDIELYLSDGTKIFSQCKSCKIDNWDHEYGDCFKDALRTMSAADGSDCVGLIYTTNIIRPLGNKAESGDFPSDDDRWIQYDELSIKSKMIIAGLIKKSGHVIDVNKLSFRIIGFTGNTENLKLKVVRDNIREFVVNSGINNNVNVNNIFSLWLDIVTFNASDEDTSITISKKQIVWLFIENQMGVEGPHLDEYDSAIEIEIMTSYGRLIDQYVERIDFTSKVLSDYYEWSKDKPRGQKTIDDFVESNWILYKDELNAPDLSDECQELLIKIIIKKIINLRIYIKKVKEAANLEDIKNLNTTREKM